MTKLEKIKDTAAKEAAKREKLRQDLPNLRQRVEDAKAKAEAAARSGSVEEYMQAHREQEHAEAELYVAGTIINTPYVANADELLAAWNEYASAYNVRYAAALKTLEKARKAHTEALATLADEQDKALKVRRECAELGKVERYAAADIFKMNVLEISGRACKAEAEACAQTPAGEPDASFVNKCVSVLANNQAYYE